MKDEFSEILSKGLITYLDLLPLSLVLEKKWLE